MLFWVRSKLGSSTLISSSLISTRHLIFSRKIDEVFWPLASRPRLQKRHLRMINQSTSIAPEPRVCERGFGPLKRAQVSQWTHTEPCWDLNHAILQRSSCVATACVSAGFKQARCGQPGESSAGELLCVCRCVCVFVIKQMQCNCELLLV